MTEGWPPPRHPLPLYGPLTLDETLGPCPPWCDGVHAPGGEEWGVGQFHATFPVELHVDTDDGELLLHASVELVQFPHATRVAGRRIHAVMVWDDASRALQPADLDRIAAGLTEYAAQLRDVAARLVELQADDQNGCCSSI